MVNPKILDPNRRVVPREKKEQEPWVSGVTVTTSSGKQYDIDRQELNWIKNRYAQDNADSYGYDTADQQAKAAGQMSAKMLSSYGKSNVDQQLAQMGLPSQKNLDKYIGQYQQWHTGGISQVFGNNISSGQWTKMKDFYKQDWTYENTAEDQERKRRGLMPVALEKNYTDTEIDDQLKASGLPSLKDLEKYNGQYWNYKGIDTLYSNVAREWTNLRLRGIKNDGDDYLSEDKLTEKPGTQWYADAFFNELNRKDENGEDVYGNIKGLFKNRTTTTTEPDPSKDYVTELGKMVLGANKANALDEDFVKYNAFSYDDFANHYDEYYDRDIKDLKVNETQTADDALKVLARQEDEKAEKEFYTVDGKKAVQDFVLRYQRDYPDATDEKMFEDMYAHGLSDNLVKQAKKELQNEPGADKDKVSEAYTTAKVKSGQFEKEQAQLWDNINYDPNDRDVVAVAKKAEEDANNKERVKGDRASLKAYVDDAIEKGADEKTVADITAAIEKALSYATDSDEGTISPNDVIAVLNGISDQEWVDATAMQKALEDYGFGENGKLTGPAADLAYNWSKQDIRNVLNSIGAVRYEDFELSDELAGRILEKEAADDIEGFLFATDDKKLDYEKFMHALDWTNEQIQGGMNEFDAYNILAADGYQAELEKYLPKKWHRALFAHERVKEGYEAAKGDQLAWYEGLTDEEKYQHGLDIWDSYTPEQQADAFKDYNWQFDPAVYRTGKQAWAQQFGAIIPGLAANLIATPVKFADMINANLTGREELWDTTKDWMKAEATIGNWGKVSDTIGSGVKLADIAADATQEVARMMVLGTVGGAIGHGTKVGQVLSEVAGNKAAKWGVRKIAGFGLTMMTSSPFVVSATAGNFAEAKAMGATTAEATRYGLITGTLEGVLESLNFDELWGKALGANSFGKMIMEGGAAFKNAGVVAKARIANLVASGLGEFTEESVSYVAETFLKMRHADTWGKGTEWSAQDWLQQAGMGFLTGLLGAGMSSGTITKDSILLEYFNSDPATRAALMSTETAKGVWNGLNETKQEKYRNGDAKILDMDQYSAMLTQEAILVNTIESKAKADYDRTVANINKKHSNAQAVANALKAKMNTNGTGESALKYSTAEVNAIKESSFAEAALAEAKNAYEQTISNSQQQLNDIHRQMEEHYAALYLQNESAIKAKDAQAVTENVSRDMQNGATVNKESVNNSSAAVDAKAQEGYEDYDAAEAARDKYLEDHPIQQTAAAAGRRLTDEEVANVQKAAQDLKFKNEIRFIDDPNEADGWIDEDGNITINRTNISNAEAKELAENPGWWVLKHEFTHFTEGTAEYDEYAGILKRIMQRRLGDSGYIDALNDIKESYSQHGENLDNRGAERELVAKFMQSGELLSNQESIEMFVREQGNLADRIYNWIRYKINDLKLRRQPNSALARDLLKAERLYAQAFRKANMRPGRNNGTNGPQYALVGRTSDGRFVFRSNYPLGTEARTKGDHIVQLVQDVWSKNPISLTIWNPDGTTRTVQSMFDPELPKSTNRSDQTDLGKIAYGNKAGNRSERRMTLDLADDLYFIAETSSYSRDADPKEKEGNKAHEGETVYHYFVNDIVYESYDGKERTPVRMVIDVHEKANGQYFHSFHIDKVDAGNQKRIARQTINAAVVAETGDDDPSISKIAQVDNTVKTNEDYVNPKNQANDTRRSTGSSWDELLQKYGAKPQGREPRARDVQVPNRASDKLRVSDFTRSLDESSKVNDELSQEIHSEIASEAEELKKRWAYIQKSNDETMRSARDYIAQKQPTEAKQEFHDMVVAGQYSLKTEAIGLQLLADAAERNDWQAVKELAIDLRVLATDAGQRTQLFNILKDLKGVGSAWYIESLVKKLNNWYADDIRTGRIDGPITVSEEAMNQVRAAKTQAEVDAAEAVVAKEIAPQLPLELSDKLSNWRYLSMLGNPVTHIRNVTGNTLMAGMSSIKDVVAAGVQRIVEKIGLANESDRSHALLSDADKARWENFAEQSYEEQRKNLQGGGKLGFQSTLQQNKRSFDNKYLDAIARGVDPGTMSEKKGLAGLVENIRNNGAMGMLEVEDAWGLRRAYKKALMERMVAQGYTLNGEGQVGKVGSDGSFTEISQEDMNKAIEWATNQAWTATFRGPSQFASMLNKISKMNTASKLIVEGVMPFKKTPINIAKTGAMYSLAGVAIGTTQLLTKVKQGKMSAAQAVDNLASGLTGSALLALGAMLAKAGILRAGGEDKKRYETFLEDTGDQTFSLKFGDYSIDLSAIAPATIPLFMGVALQEALGKNGDDDNGIDLSTIVDVAAGTLNPFMEMSFMSSLNSALKNYNSDGIGGALGNTILTAAQNYGSQYLPTIGGKVAQFVDPIRRTTKSSATSPIGSNMDYYVRSLMKKVPGVEATLQPDVDVWGRTNVKDSFGEWARDFANKFILPTNIKITNRDAVDNELIRIVESTGQVDFLPSDGAKYFKVKGETYKMNAKQYTEYSQERGQYAYAALKEVMTSPAYSAASDEERYNMLKKAIDAAYKQVNTIWKEKLGAFDK